MAKITHYFPDDDDPIFSAAFVVSSPIQRRKSPTDVVQDAELDEKREGEDSEET